MNLVSYIQVANMRHNALFRRFISALTRGGPGGLPRPIEVHAHDPLRYVGDMLGWLHQVGLYTFIFIYSHNFFPNWDYILDYGLHFFGSCRPWHLKENLS